VAELVHQEIVGDLGAPQEDRAAERIAEEPAKEGQLEEPGRYKDAHAVEPHGRRIEV
jgi:hypothetical protein